jgi:hypothetical protein
VESITIGTGWDTQTITLEDMPLDVSIIPTTAGWSYEIAFWNGGNRVWARRPLVCRLFGTRNDALLASAKWLQNMGGDVRLHVVLSGCMGYYRWRWSLVTDGEPMIITVDKGNTTEESAHEAGRQWAKRLGFTVR